jgi:hypothetical protein
MEIILGPVQLPVFSHYGRFNQISPKSSAWFGWYLQWNYRFLQNAGCFQELFCVMLLCHFICEKQYFRVERKTWRSQMNTRKDKLFKYRLIMEKAITQLMTGA